MIKDIVLYSGGLDSTVLLYTRLPNVKTLLVDYGQRHVKELGMAKNICTLNDVEYSVADLRGINHLINTGSQSGREEVPEGHYASDSMKTTIVPNRNMIMLSIAAAWASNTPGAVVCYAAHSGDHAIYPDCRKEFVNAMDTAFWEGMQLNAPMLYAPFISKTKADIVKLGADLQVPFELTWSCYKGATLHCGKCGTCVERKEAFQLAGVKDPTQYAEV